MTVHTKSWPLCGHRAGDSSGGGKPISLEERGTPGARKCWKRNRPRLPGTMALGKQRIRAGHSLPGLADPEHLLVKHSTQSTGVLIFIGSSILP